MSLYYEAAAVLTNSDKAGGSLKSRIYKKQDLKSSPAQVFALVTEASKWSAVLKEVIEKSQLLAEEKKLTPILALLLTYDLLLAKKGVAAPANHVLRLSISRHKARLSAELTKTRIRLGYPTVDALRDAIHDGSFGEDQDTCSTTTRHPRWVRINTLKSTLAEQLSTTFAGYEKTEDLGRILSATGGSKVYLVDRDIPNLLALPAGVDLSKTSAYVQGQIIFQDKASCFPAYLLDIENEDGDVIDGCAAPGNKTTHLAALMSEQTPQNEGAVNRKVIAFEKDKTRAAILEKMVKLASADSVVSIKSGYDFLRTKPDASEFANVGAILLDPSCSGSGIVGRDDDIKIHLPDLQSSLASDSKPSKSKKRKRGQKIDLVPQEIPTLEMELDDAEGEETPVKENLAERLEALSTFQLHILTHAMRFPNTRKITYSTCSLHIEENENVVFRALQSTAAHVGGWRILSREEQVNGMKTWKKRGIWEDGKLNVDQEYTLGERKDIIDACIRCEKGTEDGTMGFFVAAFVRETSNGNSQKANIQEPIAVHIEQEGLDDEEEWNGFSD